jgi:hypothetical protein
VSLRRTLEGIAKAHTHLSSVPLRIRRQLGLLGGMIADPMRINQVLANGLVNAAKVRAVWGESRSLAQLQPDAVTSDYRAHQIMLGHVAVTYQPSSVP